MAFQSPRELDNYSVNFMAYRSWLSLHQLAECFTIELYFY